MKKGLIGVQMSTIKNKIEELGVFGTFKKMTEIGFYCAEVSQIPMTPENVAEMKRAQDELGFKIAALSANLEPLFPGQEGEFLATDFDKIVNDCKTLDVDMLRIGILPLNCMGSKDKAMDFVTRAEEVAVRLKEHGIDLYYHNHHIEFVKYDGQYLLDIIKDNTELLGFELDIHWIQRGGENPIKIIEQYRDRIRLLHLKDYRVREVGEVEDMSKFVERFYHNIEFAELGTGTLPIKECIDKGLECGSEYFLIEQDDTYGRDPFESLEISRNHLIELGYEDWFKL